jgi:hypothetical protein
VAENGDVDNRKDKRFDERNDVLIKDTLLGWDPGAPIRINAHTYDISVSGARISCKAGFPAGTVLQIVIYFKKTGQVLCVDGEVKWSRRCKGGRRSEIGVEFLHAISDTVVSLIGHFYGKEIRIPSSIS